MADAHSFDSRVGTWDCTFDGGHAVDTISRDFGDAAVTERFCAHRPRPWSGMSESVWDPTGARWRLTWVDESADDWHLVGAAVDDDPSVVTPEPVGDPARVTPMVFSDSSFAWRWESTAEGWGVDWQIVDQRRDGSA